MGVDTNNESNRQEWDTSIKSMFQDWNDFEKDRQQKALGKFITKMLMRMEDSLSKVTHAAEQHRAALDKASESSNRYANRLVRATYALVFTTAVLVLTAVAQILVMWLKR